jgi:hypothetical protein
VSARFEDLLTTELAECGHGAPGVEVNKDDDKAKQPGSASRAPPGSRWRIVAHTSTTKIELENQGILDEVVLDDWLHVEQMNEHERCIRVGDARLWVSLGAENLPQVDVERGFYAAVHGESKVQD